MGGAMSGVLPGSRSSRVAPAAPTSPMAPAVPEAPVGSMLCGCGPGCSPCATAAQELQDLLASVCAGNGRSFPRVSLAWQVLWEDLEKLVERGHLYCCFGDSCWIPDRKGPVDSSPYSLGDVGMSKASSSLRVHVARKSLEVKMGAWPIPVVRSQERVEWQEGSSQPPKSLRSSGSLTYSQERVERQEGSPLPSESLHSSGSLTPSESLSLSKSLSDSWRAPDGEDAVDSSPCSLGAAGISRTRSSLRMHVARKNLEVKLGAQPTPVKSSQEEVAQQEESWSHQCPVQGSRDAAVTHSFPQLLPDRIRYENILHFHPLSRGPVVRARPFSLPVECNYPRTGIISSMPIHPTRIPFGSTVAHRRRPRFALAVFDRSWSSRLFHPSYFLGQLINVQASVGTDPREPLRVFVDQRVAAPGVSKRPEFRVIVDNGRAPYPLDGWLGCSRFLPRRGNHSLRFQLDTLLFPNLSGSQVSLRCHLRAVAPGAESLSGKARSSDREASAWHSLDAGFTGFDCSCCGSPKGCGRRRRLAGGGEMRHPPPLAGSLSPAGAIPVLHESILSAGLLGEAGVHLGLLSARPSPSPAPREPTPPPPARPSVPVLRGDQGDSGGCEPPMDPGEGGA
ncbi:uncharacterized protein LOC127465794 [Manacus candei]|uniref:uncharacterized protein LOC127465794 n=1 Tax=Manacus candei TaxID=415023 RepID=UPI002226AE84|nr:uncharacterized protein LOC127465794 [Manacus candei]